MRLSYHPKVEAEIVRAARYYEERVAGDNVRILVLKHHSRHPDYGKERSAA